MFDAISTVRSFRRIPVAALLGLTCFSYAVEPAATPPSSPASAMASITTLIGEASCETQGECHVVGIGAKACGGPSAYLAWSDRKTDPNALRGAVEAHALAEREQQKSSGLVSNCLLVPEPPVVCRPRASDGKKTCQLGQGGVGSAI